MSESVTYWRRALEHSIYSDALTPKCSHAAFGMHNDDNQLNVMVLGVWQGALKYLMCVTPEQLSEAISHNKVKDLFVQTTKLMAGLRHPWAMKLLDRLDDVVFEPILVEEGPLPLRQHIAELGHDAGLVISMWQLMRYKGYPWLNPQDCRCRVHDYKRRCRELVQQAAAPDSIRRPDRDLSSCV